MTHTPVPWSRRDTEGATVITGADGHLVLRDMSRLCPHDARFIVRACNSHAHLLEALEKIANGASGNASQHLYSETIFIIATDAIAKAQEQE